MPNSESNTSDPLRLLKRAFKPAVSAFSRHAPAPVVLFLFRRLNRFHLLPAGRSFRTNQFLGDLTVECDCTYPIEREILQNNVWDRDTVETIQRLVKVGDICMDVGANMGSLSLAMARQTGATGKVYSFEPGPTLAARLRRNVELNPKFKNTIILSEIGLSDKPGRLFYNEDAQNRGNGGLLGTSGQSIEVITADEFARRTALKRLNFVKIDVEGMELEVLKGGLETWKRFQPVLYFETIREFEAHLKKPIFQEIETMLKGIGYVLYKCVEGRLVETTSAGFGHDTVAMPSSMLPGVY
jgi:FkbM family methyltransferase